MTLSEIQENYTIIFPFTFNELRQTANSGCNYILFTSQVATVTQQQTVKHRTGFTEGKHDVVDCTE